MEKPIPDQTTLRKLYVDYMYTTRLMENIRSELSSKWIWVSIGVTTDVDGRYIANVIAGSLEADRSRCCIFTSYRRMRKKTTKFSTISRLFNKSMGGVLWPNGVHHERVILFVSDAGKDRDTALRVFCNEMLYVTRASHGLHRIAEKG